MQEPSMFEVTKKVTYDYSMESYDYNIYYPSLGSDLNSYSDIRIHVQGRDHVYHPCNSYLTVQGQLVKNSGGTAYGGTEEIALINNAPLYLFSKMAYRIDGRDVEVRENLGQTSSLYLHLQNTSNVAESSGLSACWFPDSSIKAEESKNVGFAARKNFLFKEPSTKGIFSFRIPLKWVFGFCNDYDKVIFGYDHELVCLRQNDCYALFKKTQAQAIPVGKINITSITLHMPVVTPSINMRTELLEMVENNLPLSIHFRERRGQSIDIPKGLQQFDWQFSCISLPKRPEYLLIGLQKSIDTTQLINYGIFEHSNVTAMSISVNAKKFHLHENDPADFTENAFSEFYRSFIGVRENLCGIDKRLNESHMSPSDFKNLFTIFCFDLSKHREGIREQTVSTTLHIKFESPTAKNIRCFVTSLCKKELILQANGNQIVTM